VIVDDGRVRGGLAALAEALTASGHLSSPRWRDALLTVRRHVFVPRFWQDEDPGAFPARWRMIDNATADHDEWLAAVYSDRSLPTELLGVPTSDGRGMHPLVTSSTTMPSLVIAMLEALDIDDSVDNVSVLEIGTATGYNAALLCQRLGDHRVTTIEISPELAALAQVRLAAHGYHPHVDAGDGADGVPARAPFDRIIATCGLDHIPPAWLAQTRPGGKVLLNLLGPFARHALLLLDVDEDGCGTGTFIDQTGGFMPRRTDPTRAFDHRVPIVRPDGPGATTTTVLDPGRLYQRGDWGLLVQAQATETISRQVYVDDADATDPEVEPPLATELATRDGRSWAHVRHDARPDGTYTVVQVGPRRLWDEIEALHQAWKAAGRPGRTQWTLAVDRFGDVTVQLGRPARPEEGLPDQTAAEIGAGGA